MKLKICILIDTLNKGGAERSAGLLSKILTDLGHQVIVITLFDDIAYNYSGNLINLGKYKNGSRSGLNKIARYFRMRKEIRRNEIDLLLDYRMKNFPLRELILNSFFLSAPRVNMVRNFNLNYYFPGPKWLNIILYRNYKGINVVAKEIKEQIIEIYKFNNVTAIPNPINVDFVTELSEESITIDDQFVLAVGRLHPDKQIDKLVDAYSQSELIKNRIKLYIIGQGSMKSSIEEKIHRLKIQDEIKLLGFQKNPFKYMARAKFLILASKFEGFPRVLIESLACGTPGIAFNCSSGPNEIINNRFNGLLVENQNQQALTLAMNEFISNIELYNTCKKNSKPSIQKFSMQEIGIKWQNYLLNLFQN